MSTQFQNAFMHYLSSIFKSDIQDVFIICVFAWDVMCRNVIIIRLLQTLNCLSHSLGKVSSKLLILYHKLYITAEQSCVPSNLSQTCWYTL